MKFRNIVRGLFIVTVIGIFSGCETDQRTMLTDGVWNFKNMTTDSEDETTQSLVFLAKALMTESTIEFKPDGTYLQTSPLTDEPVSGTWSLIGDDQLVLNSEGELTSTANIEVLSKSELSYMETYSDLSQTYTVTTSWSK
jgi:hypothetical protein